MIAFPASTQAPILSAADIVVTPATTAAEIDVLIREVLAMKAAGLAAAAPYREREEAARAKLAEAFEVTGQSDWTTAAGRAYMPAAGISVSYDWRALDALVASSPELSRLLTPHRSEKARPGGLTVKGLG